MPLTVSPGSGVRRNARANVEDVARRAWADRWLSWIWHAREHTKATDNPLLNNRIYSRRSYKHLFSPSDKVPFTLHF